MKALLNFAAQMAALYAIAFAAMALAYGLGLGRP